MSRRLLTSSYSTIEFSKTSAICHYQSSIQITMDIPTYIDEEEKAKVSLWSATGIDALLKNTELLTRLSFGRLQSSTENEKVHSHLFTSKILSYYNEVEIFHERDGVSILISSLGAFL